MPLLEKDLAEINEQLFSIGNSSKSNICLSKIHRQFADGVLMAKLIKQCAEHTKLVQMREYPCVNALQAKLNNWKRLNANVLHKIGLGQSDEVLNKLARPERGAIDELLQQWLQLKPPTQQKAEQQQMQANNKLKPTNFESDIGKRHKQQSAVVCRASNKEIVSVIVQKNINGQLTEVTQEMISFDAYMHLIHSNVQKDEMLRLYQSRWEVLLNRLNSKQTELNRLYTKMGTMTNEQMTVVHVSEHPGSVTFDENTLDPLDFINNEEIEKLSDNDVIYFKTIKLPNTNATARR